VDNVRLRLVPDQPDDECAGIVTAGELRAALKGVPDDSVIYVAVGGLWAMPRHDNRCILLGDPGLPDNPRDVLRPEGV